MASFANDGGPLIALDLSAAGEWQGVGEMASGDIPPDSDYARACAAGYPAQLSPVASTTAAILGAQEGISSAYWVPLLESATFYLVGVVFGDDTSDEALAARLIANTPEAWVSLGQMEVTSGRLALFHAACAGADLEIDPDREVAFIGDALTVPIQPGYYGVSAVEMTIADEGLYNVVRWAPLAMSHQ